MNVFRFVANEQAAFPVVTMCRVLGASPRLLGMGDAAAIGALHVAGAQVPAHVTRRQACAQIGWLEAKVGRHPVGQHPAPVRGDPQPLGADHRRLWKFEAALRGLADATTHGRMAEQSFARASEPSAASRRRRTA